MPVVSSSEVPTSSSSSSNSGGVSHSQDFLGLSFGFDSSSVPSQAQSAYVSAQPVSHADSSSVSFTFGGFTSDEPPLSIASVPAPSPDGPTRQHEESSSESAESGSVWGVKKSFLDVVRKNT